MKYLIDIGSSTIKVYQQENNQVTQVVARTFDFKDDFDSLRGLSEDNTSKLFSFFDELINRFSLSRSNTKLYATGIFRDILNKQAFIEDFYVQTRLFFNIISHDLEAFYLEKAWIGKWSGDSTLLVINIGGKTTELVIYDKHNAIERKMLSIGVGTIRKKYEKDINDVYSTVSLTDVMHFIKNELPPAEKKIDTAIYTGGELTYMQIAGYALQDNKIFTDEKHPSVIQSEDFYSQNERVFSEITLESLRGMMPSNPDWMKGARACSALAQAICMHYQIDTIVPSDSNLIDGVNVQELRNIVVCPSDNDKTTKLIKYLEERNVRLNMREKTVKDSSYKNLATSLISRIRHQLPARSRKLVICGSFNKHLDDIRLLINELKKLDICVVSPRNTDVVGSENGFVLFKDDIIKNHCTWSVEAQHLKAIEESDCVIVCDFDGYIGTKTSLEIGYAKRCGVPVIYIQEILMHQAFDGADCIVVCNYGDKVDSRVAYEIGYAYKCGVKIVFLEDNAIVDDFDIPSEIGLLNINNLE